MYPIRYIISMYKIQKTDIFEKWFTKLRDSYGKGKILARLKRAELGNLGDSKTLGEHLFEMRINFGPGYRVYFYRKDNVKKTFLRLDK